MQDALEWIHFMIFYNNKLDTHVDRNIQSRSIQKRYFSKCCFAGCSRLLFRRTLLCVCLTQRGRRFYSFSWHSVLLQRKIRRKKNIDKNIDVWKELRKRVDKKCCRTTNEIKTWLLPSFTDKKVHPFCILFQYFCEPWKQNHYQHPVENQNKIEYISARAMFRSTIIQSKYEPPKKKKKKNQSQWQYYFIISELKCVVEKTHRFALINYKLTNENIPNKPVSGWLMWIRKICFYFINIRTYIICLQSVKRICFFVRVSIWLSSGCGIS